MTSSGRAVRAGERAGVAANGDNHDRHVNAVWERLIVPRWTEDCPA